MMKTEISRLLILTDKPVLLKIAENNNKYSLYYATEKEK